MSPLHRRSGIGFAIIESVRENDLRLLADSSELVHLQLQISRRTKNPPKEIQSPDNVCSTDV
jgi:hypothetical protein